VAQAAANPEFLVHFLKLLNRHLLIIEYLGHFVDTNHILLFSCVHDTFIDVSLPTRAQVAQVSQLKLLRKLLI
jgi:hypothetical protein